MACQRHRVIESRSRYWEANPPTQQREGAPLGMKATQHVPIERAIKFLVDAIPLAAWEEQHLISCEE
jgi:hypothetical protein